MEDKKKIENKQEDGKKESKVDEIVTEYVEAVKEAEEAERNKQGGGFGSA